MQVTVVDDLNLQSDLGLTARELGLDLSTLVNPSSHLGRGFAVNYDRDEGSSEEGEGGASGPREGASGLPPHRSHVGDEGGEGSYGGDHVYDTSMLGVLIGSTLKANDHPGHHLHNTPSPSRSRQHSPVRFTEHLPTPCNTSTLTMSYTLSPNSHHIFHHTLILYYPPLTPFHPL